MYIMPLTAKKQFSETMSFTVNTAHLQVRN